MRWPFMLRRTHERLMAALEAERQQAREDYTNAFALARAWKQVAQERKPKEPSDEETLPHPANE